MARGEESHALLAAHTSRRGFFAGAGLAGLATVVASCATQGSESSSAGDVDNKNGTAPQTESAGVANDSTKIAFDGPHQAGIATAPQSHALVVAFNVKRSTKLREDLRRVMRIWTPDARALTQGHTALADLEPELTRAPRNLTITVGWGSGLINRAGLADKAPDWVAKHPAGLPPFKGDALTPEFSGGDIVLQICGDDLTAVGHAARVLTRGCRDFVEPVWTQRGFVDSPTGETPRNLLGFKDGTAIPRTDEEYNKAIWDSQGGSAMVVRRIVFDMPNWEALDRSSREVVFGRHVDTGAPLGKHNEFDTVDLSAVDSNGLPLIDPHSHVGLMAGEGPYIRRRAYNWDGEISPLGNSGLIFICYQNDPETAFVRLQRRLADNDRLNQWITHVGSALFWCPPGTEEGRYWGQGLLEG